MASLIRRRSSKTTIAVGAAVGDVDKGKKVTFCKKHPKHRQSPGVCSLCLNQKLSQFIAKASSSSSSRKTRFSFPSSSSSSSSSSLSDSYCSSLVSSCSSPLYRRSRFPAAREVSWLTKSRSVACVPRNSDRTDCIDNETRGWFSNLLGPRRRK